MKRHEGQGCKKVYCPHRSSDKTVKVRPVIHRYFPEKYSSQTKSNCRNWSCLWWPWSLWIEFQPIWVKKKGLFQPKNWPFRCETFSSSSHAGEQRMLPHPVSEINEAGMPFKMVDIDFFLEPMLEMEQAWTSIRKALRLLIAQEISTAKKSGEDSGLDILPVIHLLSVMNARAPPLGKRMWRGRLLRCFPSLCLLPHTHIYIYMPIDIWFHHWEDGNDMESPWSCKGMVGVAGHAGFCSKVEWTWTATCLSHPERKTVILNGSTEFHGTTGFRAWGTDMLGQKKGRGKQCFR